MIWLRLVWWIFWHGILWGTIEGGLIGTVIFPIIGTIYGLPIGALIGGIVGCITGLILTRTIRLMYHDANGSQIDKQIIQRVYVRANIIFTFLVLCSIGLIVAVKPLGSQVPNILIFGGSIPAFIEGGRASYFSNEFVDFVVKQLSNLPSRNPPVNVLS